MKPSPLLLTTTWNYFTVSSICWENSYPFHGVEESEVMELQDRATHRKSGTHLFKIISPFFTSYLKAETPLGKCIKYVETHLSYKEKN